jgi:hypothetical protein
VVESSSAAAAAAESLAATVEGKPAHLGRFIASSIKITISYGAVYITGALP